MKTTERLKEEVFQEVEHSGFFKTMQAQVKSHVYDLIDKETAGKKEKMGFQYEHPLLGKLRKYPGTSLCMDLIQQFLESFKFKHTLNVFKKEVNRNIQISRAALSKEFRIEIKNADSQSVLLSLATQLASGDITLTARQEPTKYVPQPRENNFMAESVKPKETGGAATKPPSPQLTPIINTHQTIPPQAKTPVPKEGVKIEEKPASEPTANIKPAEDKKEPAAVEKKGAKKESKKEEEKPPEGASDLLSDVMSKFSKMVPQDKEKEKKQLFESKRAFSEQKEKKVLDPSESGTNKIRGISAGKPNSFLNKFLPQPMVAVKNESMIEEELDQFQQSKDSTRKNPLFSSSESGFDKSGFDRSVDSNAIEDYEYVEKAKKFSKKY